MHDPPPGLIWLASYPKSGNTWLRLLLANVLSDEARQEDINRLSLVMPGAGSRVEFARRTLFDSRLLTMAEIDRLRPALYRYWAREKAGPLFLKVHDAFTRLDDGTPLLGNNARRAVYIVRDPRDVAGSLANHLGITIDAAATMLCDPQAELAQDPEQLRQCLLDWSAHVRSWLDQSEVPVLLVHYEDLHRNPLRTLGAVLRFLDIAADEAAVERAVRHADFAELQGQERAVGFVERPRGTQWFFRRGSVGNWRQELTEAQVGRIEAAHADVMARLKYEALT